MTSRPLIAQRGAAARPEILLDAWPPPYLPMLNAPAPAATIDLTYHVLQPLPLADAGPNDAYAMVVKGPFLKDGFGESYGELWTRDGRLVARTRQLCAVFD